MAFRKAKGIKGLVYVPEKNVTPKKHNCPDCFYCQWCSDERCAQCVIRKTQK